MKIQSVTVRHDAAQDRIVLVARDSQSEQVLLLTRRLTFSLLTALGKLIAKSQGNTRLEQAGLQDELLSMKHAQALSQVRQSQADQASPRAPSKRLPSRLLIQIDIKSDANGHLLSFSDSGGLVANLALDAGQLHWFVERLATHSQAAAWGRAIPVPEWLAVEAKAGALQGRTYSVH